MAWSLPEGGEPLKFLRPGHSPDLLRKLRRGHWRAEDELDLHGLNRIQAGYAVSGFLEQAVSQGMRCVRVVHGKGNGSPGRAAVLKDKVRGWLVQKREVLAFVQARASDGGSGALVVLLRA